MTEGGLQPHKAGGASRDGGELSWACANDIHVGCRGVNCTCLHHLTKRETDSENDVIEISLDDYISEETQLRLSIALHRSMDPPGNKRFNSAHEAYGVIKEEFEEFWDEVKKKESDRSFKAMQAELLQVAASALKYANQLADAIQEAVEVLQYNKDLAASRRKRQQKTKGRRNG